jgi:tetratricopeptide (TPR) repeat protein
MRKHLLFSLLLLFSRTIEAQNATADSLQLLELQMNIPADSLEAQLQREKEDTAKAGMLGYLCFYYAFVDPQKSLAYGQQGLALSQKLGYKRGSAYCKQSLIFPLWVSGNFNESLRFGLDALQEYEELQDHKRIAYTYLSLANVYREIGDYKRGLLEAYKGIRIHDSIHFSQKVAYAVIGSIYERQGRLDSALKYLQKAYELDIVENKGRWGWLLYGLGNIHHKMKNHEVALAYFRLALPLAIKENAQKDIVDVYNSMATLYKETGKTDSSIFYANEILQKWQSTDYKNGILLAVNTLAEIYAASHQRDSAMKYLQMSVALNKELFTQEKEREFQNMAFNEQVRRLEKEQADIQAAKERKRNLQLIGMAAFIITFMVGVIAISRKRSLLKTARFLGLIGVLLIFEFISLLTHPWVEEVTHHNPILALLVLVLLASVLVPAHHRLEDMIRKNMTRRRRAKQSKRMNTTPPQTESTL